MSNPTVNFTNSASYNSSMDDLKGHIDANRAGDVFPIRVVSTHGHFHALMDPRNLYILGFRNQAGMEYRFVDHAVPGVERLPIGSKHGAGGLDTWSETFKWGSVDNLATLVNYTKWHDKARKALAFMVVAIAEASRFGELLEAFTKMFAGHPNVPSIDPSSERWKDLINNWAVYSHGDATFQQFVRIKHL